MEQNDPKVHGTDAATRKRTRGPKAASIFGQRRNYCFCVLP